MIIPASSTGKEGLAMDPPPPYTRGEHMQGWDDANVDNKLEFPQDHQGRQYENLSEILLKYIDRSHAIRILGKRFGFVC